jgi:hypothetical protein
VRPIGADRHALADLMQLTIVLLPLWVSRADRDNPHRLWWGQP